MYKRKMEVTPSVEDAKTRLKALNYTEGVELFPKNESVRHRVERWYINPLDKLDDQHDGFAILTLLFPLYERHLRHLHGNGAFSENSALVRQIAKDLSLSVSQAYEFWQIFRNGVLHSALPKEKEGFKYTWCLRYDIIEPVVVNGSTFEVNALELKKIILKIVTKKIDIWKNQDDPIPSRYIAIDG
ncbi:MAG: hypothetical protein H6582_00015 [Crocinitomicaceae bacterium]|nr:hypothetical protein [Crocinitomicaceae bacterium]HRX30174.1 hypothetical protein [Saprospiraceae bacterium]